MNSPPPRDVLNVNVAVANVDNKYVLVPPLHKKCSEKIKHLKSTFGCLSDSVLNLDDNNKVMNRLLEIHDNDNTNTLTQPTEDDDNIVTVAEDDEVYDLYGYWKGRPRDPLEYRVPRVPQGPQGPPG